MYLYICMHIHIRTCIYMYVGFAYTLLCMCNNHCRIREGHLNLDKGFTLEAAATLANRGAQPTPNGSYQFTRDIRVKAVRWLGCHIHTVCVKNIVIPLCRDSVSPVPPAICFLVPPAIYNIRMAGGTSETPSQHNGM